MANIESTKSSFFPSAKPSNTQAEKAGDVGRAGSIKKNDPARKTQLDNISRQDAKIDISDGVKDFAKIKKVADSAEPVDNSEKIARLKQQIKDGTYNIDYDALADRILTTEF